jgi:DNA-binding GntR family transcriptional regulator
MTTGIGRIARSRSTLATEVYDRLVDALFQGSLVPGDRLIMDRLAEEMDVSRTPVRDALLRLAEEGAILPTGRRGYVVRELSRNDIVNTYDARLAIEGHAASVVAERGGSAIEQIREALNDAVARKTSTTRQSFEANRTIHRAVVAAAGNPHLLTFFDMVWGRAMVGLVFHDFYVAEPYKEFVQEHEALVEDLASGKPAHARRAMLEHIRRGLARTPHGS